jgi:DNA-binding response OmpR family regulator
MRFRQPQVRGGHFESDKPLLVAEDDETIAVALSEFLQIQGYDVTVAINGEVALDLIKQRKNKSDQFDLLIADLNMPKMSGKNFWTSCRLFLLAQKPSSLPETLAD